MKIVLPFPSSLLSGHAKGNAQWAKIKATKEHREWARLATLEARGPVGSDRTLLEDGVAATEVEKADIPITIRFIPGNDRGDRINFPNRMKPYFDGIADALKVNDKRFHPLYVFLAPEKPGRVEVYIGEGKGSCIGHAQRQPSATNPRAVNKKTAGASATNPRTGHDHNAFEERQA